VFTNKVAKPKKILSPQQAAGYANIVENRKKKLNFFEKFNF